MKKLPLVLAVFTLLWSAFAFADKVPPPPESCPPGSIGNTGHEGPHCEPLSCAADTDCKDGLVCQEQPLCIEEKMMAPGRSPKPSLYTFVRGTCEDPSSCKKPATCKAGKRCVKAAVASAATPTATPEPTKDPTPPGSATTPKTASPPARAPGCTVSSPESPGSLFGSLCLLGLVLLGSRATPQKKRPR